MTDVGVDFQAALLNLKFRLLSDLDILKCSLIGVY